MTGLPVHTDPYGLMKPPEPDPQPPPDLQPAPEPAPELVAWALLDRKGRVQMVYPNVDGKPPRTPKTMALGWTLRRLTWLD